MARRVTWVQPEDLVPHTIATRRADGCDVDELARRWEAAGGSLDVPRGGVASQTPARDELRALARTLLAELDDVPLPAALAAAEPDELAAIEALTAPGVPPAPGEPGGHLRTEPSGGHVRTRTGTYMPSAPGRAAADLATDELADRVRGAWLGRAAGCLLGKPVEKIPREGIRAIAESTGNWPLRGYFTAVGLDPAVADRYPWNTASRTTSLVENIDGMPEDDDLNYAVLALALVEQHGENLTTGDVATAWLNFLPGGRVFTAERIAYRNLLDGWPPEQAGRRGNPFHDWIGAQIRTDVYGWVAPGQPWRAARLAHTDATLSHRRNGVYGAMFVAAASSAALVVAPGDGAVDECIETGLSVVPPASRYAAAIRRGVELGRSDLDQEAAIDVIYDEYGDVHWVHVLNNSALMAFALTRSRGDFTAAITTAVAGGWDTDSTGATVGSIAGALTGAAALPAHWIDPLRNRLASSMPGFDGIGFDVLAERTLSAMLNP